MKWAFHTWEATPDKDDPQEVSLSSVTQSFWRETAVVAGVVLGLFIVMTWPLTLRFFTQAPGPAGRTDTSIALWDFWWLQTQFRHWFPNPFHTDRMFYPLGAPLAYQGLLMFYALLTAPIGWVAGIVGALNAACLWTFIASAVACYWLCRYLGIPRHGAWLAAILFAFSPFRLWRLQQHANYLATDWFAIYGLCLMAMLKTRRWLAVGLVAGAAMAGCMYCDSTFPVLLVMLSAFFVAAFVRPWARADAGSSFEQSRRIVLALGVAAVVSVVLTAPEMLAIRHANQDYNYYVETGNIALSADLLGFVVPPPDALLAAPVKAHYEQEGVTFLGYAALALALAGLLGRIQDRRLRFWKWMFIVFLILSLGPFLKVGGAVDLFRGTWGEWAQAPPKFRLTLPGAFLSYLPLVNNARAPSRFHGMTTLPFAMLAGLGWVLLTRRIARPRIRTVATCCMAGVCLAEYAVPTPTFRPQWTVVSAIAGDPKDVTVLDDVVNKRVAIEHQAAHGKRIVTGHVGRIPPEVRGYVNTTPFLREFAGDEKETAKTREELVRKFAAEPAARTMTSNIVDLLDIGYFVLNGPEDACKRRLFDGAVPYRLFAGDENTQIYRLEPPPRTGLRPEVVNVGQAEWSAYLTHGWGQWSRWIETRDGRGTIWPASPKASVVFRSDMPRSVRVEFDTFLPEKCLNVTMAVLVNGWEVGNMEVPTGIATSETVLPKERIKAGLNELEFRWPHEDGLYHWGSGPGAAVRPRLRLAAGAMGRQLLSGGLAIDGQPVYGSLRGYNLLRLSDNAGAILASANFDPYVDTEAWEKMARYIDEIPEEALVVFLSANEASKGFTPEAAAALGRLGSAFSMQGKRGWSHAGVGRKGLQPGQALETASGDSAVGLVPGQCAFLRFQFVDGG